MGMLSGLGLHPGLTSKGLNALMGMPFLWGLVSGPSSHFSNPISYPLALVHDVRGKRVVTFLVSDAISTCLLGDGLVKA